jgi:7-cyano-7-deazaguanine synthase in queuosine biosynthesis
MNALGSGFGFNISNGTSSLSLRQGEHVRICPLGPNKDFGELLTRRQIDLIRIATAVHVADGWVRRLESENGIRAPLLDIEVLDPDFWSHSAMMALLHNCVNFLSGGDDWTFRFARSANVRHERRGFLFRGQDSDALVALYSGGLDSAAGLAARLSQTRGRAVVPVNVRYQMQKAKLVWNHFRMLIRRGFTNRFDLMPFQVGAFVCNARIKRQLDIRMREVTHRCRPLLFMAVAGFVADSLAAPVVEVFESGIGSVNLPLVGGPADYRTSRSTHPHFLRLASDLLSRVNDARVDYVLPFADRTKAEMVAGLRELHLEELACQSVSCILHPLLRRGRQQCGHCPACVYRRQAMITAGISEAKDAYAVDLFAPSDPCRPVATKHIRPICAFHQQVARMAELDSGRAPEPLRRYLRATHAISYDAELPPHVEVHRRYRREWLEIISEAQRSGHPWVVSARPTAIALGAAS